MTDRLANRVALITGGTTGIGLATAQRFLEEGAQVIIASNEPAAGEAALAHLAATTGQSDRVQFVATDVAQRDDCERAVAAAIAAFGKLDLVFANAAVGTLRIGGTVETISQELWDLAYGVNLQGVVNTCRAALPALRSAGSGAIVMTSSSSALIASASRPTHAYAAMKGALISLARAMAVSYGPEQIRVNAILPGLIRTRLTADLLSDPDRAQQSLAAIPLGIAGEPIDIANAALYLASDEARFVTGTTLVVDGGATIV